ncbi:unnamed protein product [Didymodactylos carnosus]|uniref:Uncharacterized protein n=1 Tax=Didymodactylos carnosus TaxID=1234261 RepID=A0A813T0Q9_9BILA|nr:unnamed protein product [Didymodactylos carnosus]CAF0970430.1 unnamed protein product [Didymodactylos carnosus]CAF3593515.1 unnamed protein product [Didymodactylos carnosus]CAF3741851.1 unnamed protein product [Didymodactylos carnosus]
MLRNPFNSYPAGNFGGGSPYLPMNTGLPDGNYFGGSPQPFGPGLGNPFASPGFGGNFNFPQPQPGFSSYPPGPMNGFSNPFGGAGFGQGYNQLPGAGFNPAGMNFNQGGFSQPIGNNPFGPNFPPGGFGGIPIGPQVGRASPFNRFISPHRKHPHRSRSRRHSSSDSSSDDFNRGGPYGYNGGYANFQPFPISPRNSPTYRR